MSSSHDITLTPQEQALIMRLKSFRVPEMAHILEEQLKDPNADLNTFLERMTAMVDAEWQARADKRFNRLMKEAHLRYPAADLDETIYRPERQLDTQTIERLSTCHWIEEGKNLIVTGSSAQEAGIKVGNYITAVDGNDVKSMSGVETVQTRLRGESGTSVNVTWLDSEASEHNADLTHSGYTATTVDSALLQDSVGYIKIWQFDGTTPSELDYALRSLTASGATSLVFDLRDNGGGILEDAISCIDLITPEGTLAYAEDKYGNRTLLGSSTGESAIDLPLVCLVNGNTASAAELFASSLRTLSGARLVGTTTMGKGTIQSSPQRLSDGSAVVVTVAKLLCGDGSCFDGTGLTVDVERSLTADEQTSYYDFTLDTDPQIQRAVSTAQQLSGTTTVGGVNEAASSAAAEDAGADSEVSAESESAAESEAVSESEAASFEASSEAAESAASSNG